MSTIAYFEKGINLNYSGEGGSRLFCFIENDVEQNTVLREKRTIN